MASTGNPNQPGGGPFDMHQFYKPSTTNLPISQNPNMTNLSSSSPFLPLPSASFPPPTGPYSYPHHTSPFHHPQYHHAPPPYLPPQQDHLANLQHQRSISFPTPPPQPASPHLLSGNASPNPGARLMALLSAPPSTLEIPQQSAMAMPQIQPTSSGGSDFYVPPDIHVQPSVPNVNPGAIAHPGPMRMLSSKLPKGRYLMGDHIVYDIDDRWPGEVQPQLEVTPITKYISDPGLVVGRQIAVNKTYICYGLKMGNIRVLNINTALRSLLKGLSKRVIDMAFFAEDVHLLASSSVDGRVFVWKISEDSNEEEKPQISGKIVIAIHIVGEGESVHPRVCWHCHKQEILVVGIGKRVLRIDTTKFCKIDYSSGEPLKCPVDKLIDGVQFVGSHDGEVTDLSMSQWMTSRLVSASVDGTIKIWEDRKLKPIAVLRPHNGQPVHSVTFLAAPHRPDHIILITGSPLNRDLKVWASENDEGWLLPSNAESWQCTQTLELKSSAESRVEEAFFNQVVAFSQAGLFLLANAKKNAIYAVHLEYGPNPAATRMDYIAEFTVTMPILSFTGSTELLPHGQQNVQVYCVQTQAIQQYALDLSQCLPPPLENAVPERSDSSVSRDATNVEGFSNLESSGGKLLETSFSSSAPKSSIQDNLTDTGPLERHTVTSASAEVVTSQGMSSSKLESKPVSLPVLTTGIDISRIASPPLPLSPRLSRKLSGFRSPSNSSEPVSGRSVDNKVIEYAFERQMDTGHRNLADVCSLDDESRDDDSKAAQDDISTVVNHPIKFKHPTHLVTPSEILMATSSSEFNHAVELRSEEDSNIQDVVVNNGAQNVEVEVKVVGETGLGQDTELGSQGELHNLVPEQKEKLFYSQASDLAIQMARECCALPSDSYIVDESRQLDGTGRNEAAGQPSNSPDEQPDSKKDASDRVVVFSVPATVQPPSLGPATEGKKQKRKNSQGSGPSSPSPSGFNSRDSFNEPSVTSSIPSVEGASLQIPAMQETLNQLVTMQKELQKQLTVMVTVPLNKENRRLEASIGRSMEKITKANADALWAHFLEENAKQEKLQQDHVQQMTSLISNCINKDLPVALERALKKELTAVGPAVTRSITPVIEKTIATSTAETFQRGVGDKSVNQLEKSVSPKLEATVSRQIQVQFQTSGKQALQEALRSSLEASVIPGFDRSCKAMFEQVDATFQKGLTEHTTAAQQQFEFMHSPLALALRDAINSASSMTQSLNGELADGQRKLLAIAVSGANSKAGNMLVSQLSNGPLGGLHEKTEVPLDPTKELSRLISDCKFEEAFTAALQRSDVSIVSWLCCQVDLRGILATLSQGVLLALLQQLACDISKDTARKLGWMTDVVAAVDPADTTIAVHVRPIFEQVYQILNRHRSLSTTSGADLSSIRIVMHVINSMLLTCK